MELFKTEEDKVLYVETLTCLATAGEKITESNKILIYNILQNYGLPQKYADRIWQKIRLKPSLDQILAPIIESDREFKLLLVQELVMAYLANGKYIQEKSKLIQICKILNINIKLESIKQHVLNLLNERQKKITENLE